MITPPYLNTGDAVGITAPSRCIPEDTVLQAARLIESFGYRVKFSEHLFGSFHQFSGTDDERLEDMQRMLDDPEIKAIFCARGGYGMVRIIDKLDFKLFKKYPKWVLGFSDITVFLAHLYTNLNTESLHAQMPVKFADYMPEHPVIKGIFDTLAGNQLKYEIPEHPFNRRGTAEGDLVGGNLSILYNLNNTPSDYNTTGKILFIEDVDEYLYHIDRMMWNLDRSGKLSGLAGLIVGGMSDMNDNNIAFGIDAYEIIYTFAEKYNFPLIFNFPAGHEYENRVLIIGRKAKMDVGGSSCIAFRS